MVMAGQHRIEAMIMNDIQLLLLLICCSYQFHERMKICRELIRTKNPISIEMTK